MTEPHNLERATIDGGFVRYVDHMGSDLSIVRAARVSHNTAWRDTEDETSVSDERLIQYLMKNKHTSPFEAVVITFEVKAPIFIFRQWHRHRTWSYNEVSGRYTELDMGFYVPPPEVIGQQSKSNKQTRVVGSDLSNDEHTYAKVNATIIRSACNQAFQTYQTLLDRGVPRELARSVLPVATFSRMKATVDLHNLFHFIRLRLDAHSQWEIQQYAEKMLEIAKEICPVAVEAFIIQLVEDPTFHWGVSD